MTVEHLSYLNTDRTHSKIKNEVQDTAKSLLGLQPCGRIEQQVVAVAGGMR